MTTLVITKEASSVLGQYLLSKKLEDTFSTHDIESILGGYLKNSLPNSIQIDWPLSMRIRTKDTFLKALANSLKKEGERRFFDSVLGWGAARGSSSWPKRAQSWYTDKKKSLILYKDWDHKMVLDIYQEGIDVLTTIPVWLSSLDFTKEITYDDLTELCKKSNLCQEILLEGSGLATGSSPYIVERTKSRSGEPSPYFLNTESFSLKIESNTNMTTTKAITIPSALTSAVEQNKEALQLAAKLSVGKTANSFLVDALTAKLPWYAKLFGQKQALKDNPLTKVATAQLANLLAQHFAKDNAKVTYVADAMLQEAMVDLITNADVVNDLITKLGSFAGELTVDASK